MFINPKTAITEGWITHPECNTYQDWVDNKFVSPNAIDFTLDIVHKINANVAFHISEQGKKMRGTAEYPPIHDRREDIKYWKLEPNSVYDGMSNMFVNIPENVCAELIIRSTYSRNGIFMTSGIFDAKYSGHIGFALHNRLGEAYIGTGTRIGQIKFIQSDSEGEYAGGYNHVKGTHYSE